jgi:hypothetical protein
MEVNNRINLRAMLHDALIADAERCYGGKNSATMSGKYFYINIGIHVSLMLKPTFKK